MIVINLHTKTHTNDPDHPDHSNYPNCSTHPNHLNHPNLFTEGGELALFWVVQLGVNFPKMWEGGVSVNITSHPARRKKKKKA